MTYISATHIHRKKQVAVWERKDPHERVLRLFNADYSFYVDDENGEATTIYGNRVTKLTFESSKEQSDCRRQYKDKGMRTWESDITPEFKVLSSNFHDVPAPALNVTFFDIEVDYDPTIGFSSPSNPYAPVNAITLLHYWKKQIVVILVPPDDTWTKERLIAEIDKINVTVPMQPGYTVDYRLVNQEADLLRMFLSEIENSDVLSGWNSDFFDLPYMAMRIASILDKEPLSLETNTTVNQFTGAVKLEYAHNPNGLLHQPNKYKNVKRLDFPSYGQPLFNIAKSDKDGRLIGHTVSLKGRLHADYLMLYKKYEPGERHSFKLSAISDEVLQDPNTHEPTLPKLEYQGSLADLYKENFAYFARYNIRDAEILGGFEDVLGYVETANQNYHLSTGLFPHVFGTIQLADGALVNYCHHTLNCVVNDMERPQTDDSIDGALVLFPQVGMQERFGSIDARSLYPSAIRSINASPETLIGQFTRNSRDFDEITAGSNHPCTLVFEDNTSITLPGHEWSSYLVEHKYSISGFGTVFNLRQQGFLPAVLTDWFAKRKQFQKLSKEFAGVDDTKSSYYDKLQYVYKIKLNSMYGALTNLYFRFYDLRLGESTTATGRTILKHQCRKVSEMLDGDYNVDFPLYETIADAIKSGYTEEEAAQVALYGPKFNGKRQSESVIYGDTDSVYFKTHASSVEQAAKIADHISNVINNTFPDFMRRTFKCIEGYDNIMAVNREIISDRGIFVDKKRYIIHVVDSEGKKVDKMKIMGLDTKKTTIPAHVSTKLNGFIESLLKDKTWEEVSQEIVEYKDELIAGSLTDLRTIGLPKGVNGVEEYTNNLAISNTARLPGHVAAAIHYNKCLEQFNDKASPTIMSGMKIKVYYLKGDHGRFKSIALPTDIEHVPRWFAEYCKIDIDKHIERLVDNPLTNILKAIGKKTPTKRSIMVESAWDY